MSASAAPAPAVASAPPQQEPGYRKYFPSAVALVGGVVITVTLFSLVYRAEQQRMQAEFERWAQLPKAALQRDIDSHVTLLRSLESFFFSSDFVDREEFRRFTRDGRWRVAGVHALMWIPRVPASERKSHETGGQPPPPPGYQILERNAQGQTVPAGPREEFFPVFYVVPGRVFPQWLGFDVATMPSYVQAMKRSLANGEPVVTPTRHPVSKAIDPDTWLLFLGIYDKTREHRTPEQRQAGLVGFVAEAIAVRQMVDNSLRTLPQLQRGVVAIEIHDDTGGNIQIHQSDDWPGDHPRAEQMQTRFLLNVGKHAWTLVCRPTVDYLASRHPWQAWVVLGGGLVLSVLLAYYLAGLSGRAARIERLVAQRTTELGTSNQKLTAEIAERERAEKLLQNNEALYRSLVETLPMSIVRKDLEGRVVFGNSSYCRVIGKSLEELVGKTDYDLFPRELADKYRGDDRKVLESGEVFEDVEEHVRSDGTRLFVHVIKAPMRDAQERFVGTQVIFWDVTARKSAEQALERERHLVDILMDTIPDHIYFKDRESRFLRISRSMTKRFRVNEPEAAVGKTDFDFFTGEHARSAFEDEQRILATGEPMIGREEKETWPDGSVTWVSSTKQCLFDKDGNIIGTFGISRDITKRKLAEEALARKTDELMRSNQELEQFAYVASHDLQEPLRMISSYTQLLARRYQGRLDKDADEFIAYAVDGAARMQTLINDLLTYSRVGTRGKPFAPTDCNEVAQRTLDNLKIAIEDCQAVIHRTSLPRILADGVQLTQLFQNLVGNALKFRGDRPPVIHISATVCDPPAGAAAGEREWTFAVRDNGIGIEPEYFERIFVIFQRLHSREEYPGNGIGLAVCKKIVERHDGRIWVESVLGQGSTFSFALPERLPHSP